MLRKRHLRTVCHRLGLGQVGLPRIYLLEGQTICQRRRPSLGRVAHSALLRGDETLFATWNLFPGGFVSYQAPGTLPGNFGEAAGEPGKNRFQLCRHAAKASVFCCSLSEGGSKVERGFLLNVVTGHQTIWRKRGFTLWRCPLSLPCGI